MFLKFWAHILCLSVKYFISPCLSSLCSSNTYKVVPIGAVFIEIIKISMPANHEPSKQVSKAGKWHPPLPAALFLTCEEIF